MAAMRTVGRLLLLTVLMVGQKTIFGMGAPTLNPFPLGTIGCKLSDVCAPGQRCKDDQLFGSCESLHYRDNKEDEYEFQLTLVEMNLLEDQIQLLVKKGFTWKDAFTQCSLQNLLLGFAQGETFDPRWCEKVLSESLYEQSVQEDITTVLQKLLDLQEGKLQADSFEQDSLIPNSIKRDEFVDIHKYFDRSKGQFKRDPFSDDEASFRNYLSPLGVSNSNAGDFAYLQDIPIRNSENLDEGSDVSDKMEQYLETLEQIADAGSNNDIAYGNFGPTDFVEETAGPESIIEEEKPEEDLSYLPLEQAAIETQMNRDQEQDVANEGLGPLDKSDEAESQEQEAADVPSEEANEDNTDMEENSDAMKFISPPDENTLEELLEGKLEARDLDNSQLQRLTQYVEAMVDTLDTSDPIEVAEKEEKSEVDEPFAEEAENLLDQSEANVDEPVIEEIPLHKKAASVGDNSNNRVDDGEMEIKPKEMVKTRYVNMEVTPQVPQNKLVQFVLNLSKIIGLNETAVDDIQVHDGKVVFEVKTNPYMNASDVVDKINSGDVRGKILEQTGYELTKDGIGKENQVELKKDRYVVLTFILVGSIAGILLAVVVIYVIKRHTLSRKKLAQLSSNGETNEASKDYQDLCRQRMQSKSSEKPEPLHAASRIGSVSESQVRSPSSRSSTSSWSEEPVTSNMDISTGHIVLSYMEDHLKNQDRLDQEWEALCSYEADPCATIIAADASNTRKNRYSDVLPYDHSRVVISTAANVSGSDYVNANFITDHDPRNPAFIATQGPLPHTVADFWQMIWEQGSVVIVMLTKLTENGSAMCHRYWPEEGSDLYHIYEVHLVSEHIWCDDYLVRSFYLKNLQTNETRTVTQFHFLTWPNLAVPGSIKALLDFRRKVNKSYRGRSCPIVVHCSDGCGRTGTYCLIDMVLNRLAKGAKEIDMAATLEHIRDQRMTMVKTKEQFQFSLAAVAEEVHAILKALPQ